MDNIHKRAVPIGNLAPQLYTPLIAEVCDTVNRNGFVFLQPPMVAALLNSAVPGFVQGWEDFRLSWGHLDQDAFMGDGGTYRFRRYANLLHRAGQSPLATQSSPTALPHHCAQPTQWRHCPALCPDPDLRSAKAWFFRR